MSVPRTPIPRVGKLRAALPFLAVPSVLVAGGTVVLLSLRDGDGSGRMTLLILVAGGCGLVFAVGAFISLLQQFTAAGWIETQSGKNLLELAEEAGTDAFSASLLALVEQWLGGARPDGGDLDAQLEFLRYRLGKGPSLVAAMAEPMPVLGILGTCLSLIDYLRGTISALTSADKVGLDLIHELGTTLQVLPSAFISTVAGIVAGPLLLRGMSAALFMVVEALVMRFDSVMRSYVLPLLLEEPDEESDDE